MTSKNIDINYTNKYRSQFISPMEERCDISSLIAESSAKQIIVAAELIKIPSGGLSFFSSSNLEVEIIIVLKGYGTLVINGKAYSIRQGEVLHVPSNATRAVSNIDSGVLEIISIRFKNI
jgi:quercetin dioxygenase-like cupin family protein